MTISDTNQQDLTKNLIQSFSFSHLDEESFPLWTESFGLMASKNPKLTSNQTNQVSAVQPRGTKPRCTER